MTEVSKIIQQIKDFNLDDPYNYEKLILFKIKQIELPILTYKIPKGIFPPRSRDNKKIDFFEKIKDLSCLPKDCVKNFNRSNRPYQSMFYCSNKKETSYSEFVEEWREKPIGSVFNITSSIWETLQDLNVHLIYNRKTMGEDFNSIIGEDWNEDNLLINDFLVDIFQKSSHNNKLIYVLTSAISNVLLLRSKLDGIMFPCVPTNGNGLNLVLKPGICNKNYLKIKHVIRDTFMTIKNENNLKANHINIASIDGKFDYANGLILWE